MSWLASQSSFLLTCDILECKVYIPHVPQVSPVQFHLYTMILQFPPCLLILNQKELEEDLIWAMLIAQGLVICFCERLKSQNRISTELEADRQSWCSCKQLPLPINSCYEAVLWWLMCSEL